MVSSPKEIESITHLVGHARAVSLFANMQSTWLRRVSPCPKIPSERKDQSRLKLDRLVVHICFRRMVYEGCIITQSSKLRHSPKGRSRKMVTRRRRKLWTRLRRVQDDGEGFERPIELRSKRDAQVAGSNRAEIRLHSRVFSRIRPPSSSFPPLALYICSPHLPSYPSLFLFQHHIL